MPTTGAKPKRKRITLSTVKSRGWTEGMVKEVLGEPDATAPNPHYSSKGAPMRLYYEDRVIEAESTEVFRAAKEKADRRRESSKKGLAAARAVNQAAAIMKAEADRASEEAAADNWAYKYMCAALSDSPSMSMRTRKEYRATANELLEFLDQQMCSECKWRHIPSYPKCPKTITDAHNEVKLAAAVNEIFPMPDDPLKDHLINEESWKAEDDPDFMSKSEVRRVAGYGVVEQLGEPDKVITKPNQIVKLYSRQRVQDFIESRKTLSGQESN